MFPLLFEQPTFRHKPLTGGVHVQFEVFMVVVMRIHVFWDMTLC